MSTKEQEREALKKIVKIVDALGPYSYVGTALTGCFEIAEQNIENDWACSLKDRAEIAERKIKTLELDNRDLRLAIKKAKESSSEEVTALQLRIEALEKKIVSADDLTDCVMVVQNDVCEDTCKMEDAAKSIVALADNPTSAEFAEAVRLHRAWSNKVDYEKALIKRLEAARDIMVG